MKAEGEGSDDEGQGTGGPHAGNFAANTYSKRNVASARGNEGANFIYHELQESALCGQHCMNNLLQSRCFTEMQLGAIAQQLDAEERMLGVTESANVDATGNFSIQVLRRALQQSHNIELVAWGGTHPLAEDGYIVNRKEHWFAFRKINGRWFNLNSTMERPEAIQDAYFGALLQQMKGDGFLIFAPTRGLLPACGKLPSGYRGDALDARYWLKEEDVLNPPLSVSQGGGGGGGKSAPTEAPKPFSGRGNRLDGRVEEPPPQPRMTGYGMGEDEDEDPELAAAIAASLAGSSGRGQGSGPGNSAMKYGSDEEADLALAMQLSLSEGGGGSSSAFAAAPAVAAGPAKSEKEIQREKRLAALAARGL